MHLDSVRPQGSWIGAAGPGATDYLRWDRNQAKLVNGDLGSSVTTGTSPPVVTFSGTPLSSVQSIEIDITAGGNPGTFKWKLNGVVQASGVSTGLGTYALSGTGMTAHFSVGPTYSADNVYRFGPWAPTSPIYVGGSGVNLSAGTSLVGGVRTERGGSITLGASDLVPQLSPPRTRSIFMSMVGVTSGSSSAYGDHAIAMLPNGAVTIAQGVSVPVPSRFLHHNGTSKLTSVVVSYVTSTDLITLSPPGFTFVALDSSGNLTTPTIPFVTGPSQIWTATTGYTTGQYVRPVITIQNTAVLAGSYFRCLANGTSGGSPPSWNFTPGSTTPDGGTSWLCIGGAGAFTSFAGQIAQARYDVDPTATAMLDISHRHQLRFGSDTGISAFGPVGSFLSLIGVVFNFSNITDMSFY